MLEKVKGSVNSEEPQCVLSWDEYDHLIKASTKLEKISEKFKELEKSTLHNRDNLIRFFREVLL